jgi:BirA family biotin operon repressor/biotin-[acetyl-CoA-carboxylase] ligase
LTEGSFNIETGQLDYAIIGIRVNIFTETFPDEIKKTATSLLTTEQSAILRNDLASEIINNLSVYCENDITADKFMPRYKSLSLLLGKNINIISGDKKEPAFVLNIDDKAQLVVLDKNKQKKTINSGEVSIRLNENQN